MLPRMVTLARSVYHKTAEHASPPTNNKTPPARSGSKHLKFLMDNQLVILSPSKILDEIYALQRLDMRLKALKSEYSTIRSQAQTETTASENPETASENLYPQLPAEQMLLSPSSGRLIAECLEVPDIEQEVERAIHQVEASLKVKQVPKEEEEKKARD